MSDTTKIVINSCYGGFSLSDAAVRRYAELKGVTLYPETERLGFVTYWTLPPEAREGRVLEDDAWSRASSEQRAASNDFYRQNTIDIRGFERTDPLLVQVVEELGKGASGMCAGLEVETLPKGTLYRITEYDGYERIETRDDIEWQVA